MTDNNANINLLEIAIASIHNKCDSEKSNGQLKCKTAKVISYDADTRQTTVSFIDDNQNNEYMLINKTNENLSENDTVKVFYTTNAAKGWIGARMGEPIVEKTPAPYISSTVTNVVDSELGGVDETIFSLDFKVEDTDSDSVLNVNQVLLSRKSGTVDYSYFVDGVKQDFTPRQVLHEGKNIIPHIVPMHLDTGGHSVAIKMKSDDTIGDTYQGDVWGVISGQISGVSNVIPENTKMIFYVEIENDGDEIGVPSGSNFNYPIYGTVNWGDGTVENDVNTGELMLHTYEKAGTYKISISAPIVDWIGGRNQAGNDVWKSSIRKIICPSNLVTFGLGVGTNLEYIDFGKSLVSINYSSFANCLKLTSVKFPETIKSIGSYFTNTGITSLYIPPSCDGVGSISYIGIFSGNKYLTTVKMYGKSIYYGGFAGCSVLQDIELKNVTSIGDYAFSDCTSLKQITLPSTLTSIGKWLFQGSGMEIVKFEKGNWTDSLHVEYGWTGFTDGASIKEVWCQEDLYYYLRDKSGFPESVLRMY